MPLQNLPLSRVEIHGLIQERFRRVAQAFPDNPAIVTASQTISYSELDALSNRIAWAIMDSPHKGKPIFGILLEQGILSTAAILGVLKAGKCFILISPEIPIERLKTYWEDTDRPIILTVTSFQYIAQEFIAPEGYVLLDEIPLDPQPNETPVANLVTEEMAAIFYTSGSTGEPKGVIWSHELVLHTAFLNIQSYLITANDKIVVLSAFGFGAAMTMSFATLLSGATLYFYPAPQLNPTSFLKWISEQKVTILSMTTSGLFRQILHELKDFPPLVNIRCVILGGDDLFRSDVDLFFTRFPRESVLVYRLAGSETMLMREIKITPSMKFSQDKIPVGYEVPDKELLLLNENQLPVAMGDIGEIAIRSQYLSPGYWKQPELTSLKFRADLENKGMRIYHTGDLGRINEMGQLEFLGRKDNMVKIRGFSVQLEAIEQKLQNIMGIKEAIVVLLTGDYGSRLTAYMKSDDTAKPKVGEIKRALSEHFPEHSIPSAYCWVEEFPRISSGKIDRKNLPNVPMDRPDLSTPYQEARNEIESSIVSIWQKILGIKDIGINDSFFELGGDSLSSLEMVLEIERAHHVTVPQTFFRHPDISSLAKSIFTNDQESTNDKKFAIVSEHFDDRENQVKNTHHTKQKVLNRLIEKKRLKKGNDFSYLFYRFLDRRVGKYLGTLSYEKAIAWSVGWSSNPIVRNVFYTHRRKLFERWLEVLSEGDHKVSGSFQHNLLTNMFFQIPKAVSKKEKDPYGMEQIYLRSRIAFWRSLGELIEHTPAEEIPDQFPMVGLEYLQAAKELGKGVILLSFHGPPRSGGFLPLAKMLGVEGIPTISYLIPMRQSRYDERREELSETSAFTLNAEIALYGQKILQQGGVVNFASDANDMRGKTYRVMIGNRQYQVKGGFAEMALNTGAVIIPFTRYCLADGRVQMEFFPQLEVGEGTREEIVERLIREYGAFMESCWYTHPEANSWTKMRKHLKRPKGIEDW